ncbi:microcystinase C [Roseobacter cerasinus]|uniref:Microcystinase C n=1 Tax=Roseobacter cerasinus TaxID=2602289 RepID=A0A640VR58_9RHOB|nr:M81 family metallopeptidase [Roseobacter cerasinus]GFE49581.1 microcystinase C [Roseobacter cerasinus]
MTLPRVALLGAVLESNRYAKPAEAEDFTSLTWLTGPALMVEARQTAPKLATEFAAFVRAMDATGPWEPVPCILAASHPAGPVRQSVFDQIVAEAEAALSVAGPVDAVYICNHGAMVAEHDPDLDGALMARVREVVGPDILIVGYRTNPHVDQIERGEEAAFSLRRCLASDQRPQIAHVKLPLVPASVALLSGEAPYGTLIDVGQRRQAELRSKILNVSIFGNFLFSDVPDNGLSIVVTARDDKAIATGLADELAQLAWAARHQFVRSLTTVEEAVARAMASPAPVIFSDAGDNPGGGGSGRTTELLAAVHAAGVTDCLFGSICDPELASEAHEMGVGGHFRAVFNRSSDLDVPWEQWDKPFEAEAEVVALHDGNVVGERGMTAGRRLTLGPSAALRIDGITVVVITDRTQTADPVFFHMMGLDPGRARTVVVKSRGHFRAGFAAWFSPEQVFEVDTAGLTSPVHDRWPLTHVPRPNYPMDPDTVWP